MTATIVALVAALALPGALTSDLGAYLDDSANAEYSGEQLVTCDTPDGPRDSVFAVAQTDGIVMAWADNAETPIVTSAPGMNATVSGEEVEATAVEGTFIEGDGSPLFSITSSTDTRFLGREAAVVLISRDGLDRVELTVDNVTDAVLRTRVFSSDGVVYCDRRMLSFDDGPVQVPEIVDGIIVDKTEPLEGDATDLPASLAGFRLVDTYPIEEGTLSYYSDGFFSLAVGVSDRSFDFDETAEVSLVPAKRGTYTRSFEAGRVTVTWRSPDGHMAVIGDLPPDLLDEVLGTLPGPADPGFFGRIWSRLFG